MFLGFETWSFSLIIGSLLFHFFIEVINIFVNEHAVSQKFKQVC